MSATRDPDQILHAWLEEGPTALPAPTIRAIEVATRATAQRRPAIRLPWRPKLMPFPYKILGAAAALAVVLIAGAMLLGPRSDQGTVGGSSVPSPTPSATPVPTAIGPTPFPTLSFDASTWTAFTSSRYGFSAKYPPTFEAVPSNFVWRMPNAAGNMFDGFHGAGAVKWLNGVSSLLPAGATRDGWYAEYRRDLVEDELPWEPEACFTPRDGWSSTTVDGNAADLRIGCETLEAYVFVAGRVYVFGAYSYEGVTPPTTQPGVTDELRDLFELWLTTITLDPPSAQEQPSTPIPSAT